MRVRDAVARRFSSDPNGEFVLQTMTFHQECLHVFYCGLRNQEYVKICVKKGVKNLEEALFVISEYLAAMVQIKHCT